MSCTQSCTIQLNVLVEYSFIIVRTKFMMKNYFILSLVPINPHLFWIAMQWTHTYPVIKEKWYDTHHPIMFKNHQTQTCGIF